MKSSVLKWGVRFLVISLMASRGLALEAEAIVHEGAVVGSLTRAALKDILTGKTMHWEGGQAITLVYLAAGPGEAALKEASGMDVGAFKTFWQRLTFSGRGQQPKKVDSPAAAVAVVSSTKGAFALVPVGTPLEGVKRVTVK